MKFVVNRVNEKISCHSTKELQNQEVDFKRELGSGKITQSFKGYYTGFTKSGCFCAAFTVAEVPDTEEGYYLL